LTANIHFIKMLFCIAADDPLLLKKIYQLNAKTINELSSQVN